MDGVVRAWSYVPNDVSSIHTKKQDIVGRGEVLLVARQEVVDYPRFHPPRATQPLPCEAPP